MPFTASDHFDVPDALLPWGRTAEERARQVEHARSIVGQPIVAVRYSDIDHGAAEAEAPWQARGFHSIAYGVELDVEDGRTFSTTWVISIDNVGMTFRAEPLVPRWQPPGYGRLYDVTGAPEWELLLGDPVTGVALHWWGGDHGGCHSATLRFDHARIHIILGQAEGNDLLYGADENVAVVFDEEMARAARLGPWNPSP